MTVLLRSINRLTVLALLAGWPVVGAQAAQTTIKASAKVVKPLSLAAKQDLDFGTILLSSATGTGTVSISLTGVVTCGSGLTCSGTPKPGILNITGSNGQVVRISAAPSDLVNAASGGTIRFTPVTPATLTLTNSGNPGQDFNVGGSIAIPLATVDGVYTGNVEVTVDYQ